MAECRINACCVPHYQKIIKLEKELTKYKQLIEKLRDQLFSFKQNDGEETIEADPLTEDPFDDQTNEDPLMDPLDDHEYSQLDTDDMPFVPDHPKTSHYSAIATHQQLESSESRRNKKPASVNNSDIESLKKGRMRTRSSTSRMSRDSPGKEGEKSRKNLENLKNAASRKVSASFETPKMPVSYADLDSKKKERMRRRSSGEISKKRDEICMSPKSGIPKETRKDKRYSIADNMGPPVSKPDKKRRNTMPAMVEEKKKKKTGKQETVGARRSLRLVRKNLEVDDLSFGNCK